MENDLFDIQSATTEQLVQRQLLILEVIDEASTIVTGELAGFYEEILNEMSSRGFPQKSKLLAA